MRGTLAASPRLLAVGALVLALVTAGLAVLDHHGFLAGVLDGVLAVATVVLGLAALVRRRLEGQLAAASAQISELMGGADLSGLLGALGKREEG